MEIHFEIMDRCLLKCKHCSSMASILGREKKYSEQDMFSLLEKINGKKEVFLTGGEPLLYKELEKMLKSIRQIPDTQLGLFTTGILMDVGGISPISEVYAKKLQECGLEICYLSVYSYLEEEHDWMTRLHGSFKMLNESIKHLQKAGIEVRFNSVVTKKNYLLYEKLIEFAESSGVTEVRILKLIRQGRAKECWQDIAVTEEDYRNIVLNAVKRSNKLRITASGAIDILPCRINNNNISICPAGVGVVYVTYEGNVFPCASVKTKEKYKIGNITDADINKKLYTFQKKTKGEILCKVPC